MHFPLRVLAGVCVAGMSALVGAALDAALIGVFRSHLRRALAPQAYRPVYLRSGRRNRVRY